jgi:hypothetical protein
MLECFGDRRSHRGVSTGDVGCRPNVAILPRTDLG